VLKGSAGNAGNIPISLTAISDVTNYALSVKNLDAVNGRSFRALDSSGGVLLSADGTGVAVKSITGGLTISSGGLTVTSGGLTVTAGGLVVTAGTVGIGGVGLSNVGVNVSSTALTTTSQVGLQSNPTSTSAATLETTAFYAVPATAAAAYTCTTVAGFHAITPSRGAGSTITNAYGVLIDAINSGGTNNYGIFINAPSGGATNNYAIFSAGAIVMASVTTPTVAAGQIGFGTTLAAVGGGAAATLGTIGGSGPGTAGMNQWWKINVGGTAMFIPVWA
jgi:hypothetical protein